MASELAAVVLSASLQKAKSIVQQKALNHIYLILGFPEQLETMEGHVEAIEAVLADAESKKTGRVSLWLNNVSGVALEAEIVLDELLYESLRRQVLESNGGAQEVCSSFLFLLESGIRDIYFRMMLGSRVQSINARFKEFNSQISTLGLVNGERPATDHVAANRETNSLTCRLVVGRKKEEREIVKLLLDSSNNNFDVSVLPIVGMGGLGKTTLAKSVYNNQQIVNQFSKRSWTCVSNKVGCADIFRGILESLKGGESVGISRYGQDAIVQGIKKELKGERFLFVLDDVWDFKWWGNFIDIVTYMARLNSTGGGCCVLITTRSEGVANDACVYFRPFRLKKLSDDQCWSIIVERVKEGEKMVEGLEVYKEKLLKRCQGLPLAANAIGGLLGREDWSSIVDRILRIQEDVDEKIMSILRLSYDSLPSRFIKSCFVYCSVYPKDAELDGEKLIELWLAEGFLQEGVIGGRTVDKVGADYLTILLQSSLLEKHHTRGGHYYFKMNGLIHDFAESISKEQHTGDKYSTCRHIVFLQGNIKMHWNEKSTLIRVVEGEVSDEMLLKYRHARVMNLFSREIKKLPNGIGKLKHVRCLTLSLFGGIKSLPESLCNLYYLQTLRLSDCKELDCLPQGLSNLIRLRHLHFSRGEDFKMPPNMGRLSRLQTFEFFNVGEENGRGIEELGSMKKLKGSLSLRNLELVKGKEEATSADLFNKKNLTSLELVWGWTTRRSNDKWEDVLEGLEPCSALLRLKITNFMGVRFPGWLGKLSALVSLQLKDCNDITELGYSGDSGFPNLKFLWIEGCRQLSSAPTSFPILTELRVIDIQVSGVKDIIITTTNSLQVLTLKRVSGMRRLSDLTGSSLSSCLKTLDIRDCRELTEITLEWFTSLKSLYIKGCPYLQTSKNTEFDVKYRYQGDAILPRGF